MPDMTPVGDKIIPPNPQGGINTFSGILGLQQQRQALTQGQQQIGLNQAELQKQQQAMQERLWLQNAQKSGLDEQGNSLLNEKGELDPDKFIPAVTRNMPLTGQPVVQSVLKTQADKTNLDDSVRQLGQNYRNDLSGIARSFLNNPNAKGSDIESAFDKYAEQNPRALASVHWATNLVGDHFDNMAPDKKNEALNHLAEAMQPAALTTAQTMPEGTTNAAGQILNRNRVTGALSGPQLGAGASNPSAPQIAGQTTRQVATGNADVDRANEVGSLQQQSSAAIELTKRIDKLSHDIGNGTVSKMISETGNYFGLSSINEARSELNKDLGQVKGLAISRAGSDSRAATILEGYPTDTTPEHTVHVAMDYLRGTARQNLARGALLSQYQKADPQGLRGFQAADNVLTGSTNPLMHEYLALRPQEQAAFYRRNFSTPQEAQAFKDQVNALKKHTSVLQ